MAASAGTIAQECVEGYLFVRRPLSFLLLRRPPARGSIWVPVSGKVEPTDADLISALRRELTEETGFRTYEDPFSLDWHVPFTGPDGRPWRLHAYGVELPDPAPPRLSPEHVAYAWVPQAVALERLHYPDNQEALRRLGQRISENSARPGLGAPAVSDRAGQVP